MTLLMFNFNFSLASPTISTISYPRVHFSERIGQVNVCCVPPADLLAWYGIGEEGDMGVQSICCGWHLFFSTFHRLRFQDLTFS